MLLVLNMSNSLKFPLDNFELTCSGAVPTVNVERLACARHGRELMGLKSPVCDPVLSHLLNIKY
jgi:hypothetical protein